MSLRLRITLWITGSGLLAALLFSTVIFFELIEQPYEIIDQELGEQAVVITSALAVALEGGSDAAQTGGNLLGRLGDPYWIEIFDGAQQVVYASAMTQQIRLPVRWIESGHDLRVKLPPGAPDLGQEGKDQVVFRGRSLPVSVAGVPYQVHIAKPLTHFTEEIKELMWIIGFGLVFFTLSLVIFSSFAAGRIMKPIAAIGELARQINDQTLDRRIPTGKNQDELHRLITLLNSMFDRLQFSFERQKQFFADGAHELKTPLSLQRLFFEETRQRNDLPDDLYPQLETQWRTHYRMERLVRNLLVLSALEMRDTLHRERLDLSELVGEVTADFAQICQAAGIALQTTLQDGVFFVGDREKLCSVLINVFDNAVKYNGGKERYIQVLLQRDQNAIRLTITNSGQGIPPEEQNRIFEQFYRIEKSRSSALGGSGLGLAIVKRIVTLHQGTITVTSEPGAWVSFCIMLPLSSPSA